MKWKFNSIWAMIFLLINNPEAESVLALGSAVPNAPFSWLFMEVSYWVPSNQHSPFMSRSALWEKLRLHGFSSFSCLSREHEEIGRFLENLSLCLWWLIGLLVMGEMKRNDWSELKIAICNAVHVIHVWRWRVRVIT